MSKRAGSFQSRTVPTAAADNGFLGHMYTRRTSLPHSDSSSPTLPAAATTANGHESHFVVAAIDFGTTYSGYAFSFIRDPDSIHMMRKWEGGDPGVTNQKTPTTLLLKPNGDFHSFGFSARDFYHDLEESEARKWYYFEKFKMTLHSSQVRHTVPYMKWTHIATWESANVPELFSYLVSTHVWYLMPYAV